HEDLDRRRRGGFPYFCNAVDEMPGAAVFQIVAIDARDYDIRETELRDRLRQMSWLFGIGGERAAVRHVAERAAAGTDVAEDHERRRALAETLADVRAGRFLADRVQLLLA